MSDNIEGIRGEFRKPTPREIGLMVRLIREQRGIKRASLAIDASVSKKSIERVENGEVVNAHTYKKIAKALGLDGAAFTTAFYVPTDEELIETTKRDREEFLKTHNTVAVERLTDPRQLLRLFQTDALIVDEQSVDVKDLDVIAAFKENLQDWSDIAGDIPVTGRLDGARNLLNQVRTIEARGYQVRVGVTDKYKMGDTRMEMAVVSFLPTSASEMPSEVWLPTRISQST